MFVLEVRAQVKIRNFKRPGAFETFALLIRYHQRVADKPDAPARFFVRVWYVYSIRFLLDRHVRF